MIQRKEVAGAAAVVLFLATFLMAPLAVAGAVQDEHGEDEAHAFDPIHHVADGYYLDFQPIGDIELPRIFLRRSADGGLGFDFFPSTQAALRSGAYTVEAPDIDVEQRVVEGQFEAAMPARPSRLGPEELESLIEAHSHLDAKLVPVGGSLILDMSMTRHLVFALLGALLVMLVFISLARRYQRGVGRDTAPRGLLQNFFETIIVFIRDEIAKPSLGDSYRRFMPYLLTSFFFILFANFLGLVPYGATATSNLMITSVLAAFTFFVTQLNGSRDHWKHVFWPPGVPVALKPILIPIEILGLFTKPFALAIRLFANMTAGHLVILNLLGLIFVFGRLFGSGAGYGVSVVSVAFTLFIYLLEILVALIQAYVFTMLSALFIGMAVAEHPHEPEEGHLPSLHEHNHSALTPHLIMGDGATAQQAHTV